MPPSKMYEKLLAGMIPTSANTENTRGGGNYLCHGDFFCEMLYGIDQTDACKTTAMTRANTGGESHRPSSNPSMTATRNIKILKPAEEAKMVPQVRLATGEQKKNCTFCSYIPNVMMVKGTKMSRRDLNVFAPISS